MPSTVNAGEQELKMSPPQLSRKSLNFDLLAWQEHTGTSLSPAEGPVNHILGGLSSYSRLEAFLS